MNGGPRDGIQEADLSADALIALVGGRRGHFAMESGYHSALWLDLDALFAAPARVRPFVDALASSLGPHRPEVVCGPMVGGAFLAQHVAERLGAEFWYTERAADSSAAGLFAARYRLPRAFHGRTPEPRVAIVDDVMSAGSSLRATAAELRSCGATIVAVGALLVMGSVGERHFAEAGVPVEAVARGELEMWAPSECPQCRQGAPLERVAAGA